MKKEYECEFLDEITSLFNERDLRDSLDDEEEVMADSMENIQKILQGDVELI